jgi:hypothetical protein
MLIKMNDELYSSYSVEKARKVSLLIMNLFNLKAMSTSEILLVNSIVQQVVIYLGLFLFITGLIGGILNLIVFLSLRTFRESSCAFYLTIMSIVNTFHLFTGLFTFIMINGFNINWLNMSLFYCKFRQFYVQLCILMSLTCICSAVIDQFLATCAHPRWHQWNNIKFARYILTGSVIIWMLHGIPFLIYYNQIPSSITGISTCIITNNVFQKYYTIVYGCVIVTSLHLIIMILFGILGYRNVRQLAYRTVPLVRRELDKQLTKMVLIQAFCEVLSVTPMFIINVLTSAPSITNDPTTQTLLRFIINLTTIWYYFRFVVCLNIFVVH